MMNINLLGYFHVDFIDLLSLNNNRVFLLNNCLGINTSVTVRKPQAIPPSGMPADAKQNYVVPGVVNNAVKESIMTAGATTVTTMATDAHENVWPMMIYFYYLFFLLCVNNDAFLP